MGNLRKCVYLEPMESVPHKFKVTGAVFWSLIEASHLAFPAIVAHILLDRASGITSWQLWMYMGTVIGGAVVTAVFTLVFDFGMESLYLICTLGKA